MVWVHCPLKTGFLFSENAFNASFRSSVFTTLSYISFSTSSLAHETACSAALTATGPPSEISCASLTASASAALRALVAVSASPFPSSGTTSTSRSAIPRKYASGAETRRPVRMRSRARGRPISAGRRWVPPAPGRIARRVSGRPTVAVEARTRKCVDRASSRPPPRATEEMAEMVGMGSAERVVNVSRRLARKSAVL